MRNATPRIARDTVIATSSLAAAAWPALAAASFGGGGGFSCFSFELSALAGAVIAIPTATALGVIEALYRARTPSPVTANAALVLGAVAWIAGIAAAIMRDGVALTLLLALLLAPPLLALGLLRRSPWTRFGAIAATSGIAAAAIVAAIRHAALRCADDGLGVLAGAESFSMLVWMLTWWGCHRARLGEDFAQLRERAPAAVDTGLRAVASTSRTAPPRSGVLFIVDALGIFVLLGIAAELGYARWWHAELQLEWIVRDFFAWPQPQAMPSWWSLRGVVWGGVFASGLWAAGSYAGLFDVGRFRPLRPLALVVIGALLVVVFSTASTMADVEAAERAASGLRRAP